MADTVSLYARCKRCDGDEAVVPNEPGPASWLTCSRCNEPVVTWGDYKESAFAAATRTIRGRRLARSPNRPRSGL